MNGEKSNKQGDGNTRSERKMRDARVDEEVAGLLDPAARSARRSTATTYGVVKGITACLVLVSAAALVLVRHLRFSRSVTLSDGRALRARDARDARDARALSQQDGMPNAAPPSRHALRDARHARANPGALTPPFPSSSPRRFAAASPAAPRLSASPPTIRTRARGARRRGSTTCSSPAARRSSGA